MTITLDEIKEYKRHYVDELYSDVRTEQTKDQKYRDDTFDVPEVKNPHHIYRSGIGYDIVDSPAEQIITSNPQVFIKVKKGRTESGEKLAKLINQSWIPILKRQNPNPFKETVKNKLCRGESYIKIIHNEAYKNGYNLPVHFIIPDPMVVYASPEEDENGIPLRVIEFYERQYRDLMLIYPAWKNPKGRGDNGEKRESEWLGFWSSEERYFEADDKAVLKGGIQPNIYGFVPFVRKYSGFGRRAPDGNLKDLIVSDLRFSRDLIREECATRSNIASMLYLFAHRPINIIIPSGSDVDKNKLAQSLSFGEYDLNVIELPQGSTIKSLEDLMQPSIETYQHLSQVRSEIKERHPFVTAGPNGSSGRQDDIFRANNIKRYNTIIENTESEWATAFEQAIKICRKVPGLIPEGVNEDDLNIEFCCEVKLRESDPLEHDRKITLGDRLWNQGNGSIDLLTNLTEFQGRTEDEAKNIIARMLVDKLTIYNSSVSEVMGMAFAEESGMEEWLKKAQERQAQIQQRQKGLQNQPPPTTQERIQGEVQTQYGMENSDIRGARRAPSGYTRNG